MKWEWTENVEKLKQNEPEWAHFSQLTSNPFLKKPGAGGKLHKAFSFQISITMIMFQWMDSTNNLICIVRHNSIMPDVLQLQFRSISTSYQNSRFSSTHLHFPTRSAFFPNKRLQSILTIWFGPTLCVRANVSRYPFVCMRFICVLHVPLERAKCEWSTNNINFDLRLKSLSFARIIANWTKANLQIKMEKARDRERQVQYRMFCLIPQCVCVWCSSHNGHVWLCEYAVRLIFEMLIVLYSLGAYQTVPMESSIEFNFAVHSSKIQIFHDKFKFHLKTAGQIPSIQWRCRFVISFCNAKSMNEIDVYALICFQFIFCTNGNKRTKLNSIQIKTCNTTTNRKPNFFRDFF